MVTAIASKLLNIVNSSTVYKFVENPLPVFFLLYGNKHGLQFSFDAEKGTVNFKCVPHINEVESFMVEHLSENSMQDMEKDIEVFKVLWNEIQGNSDITHYQYQVIDHLINDYAAASNTPILSKDLHSAVHIAVVAFFDNYIASDKEGKEYEKNPHWMDWYQFVDCHEYDESKVLSFSMMNFVRMDADSNGLKMDDIKKDKEAVYFGYSEDFGNRSLFSVAATVPYAQRIYDVLAKDFKYGATLCFDKKFCQTSEFHELCKDLIVENRVNFVIEIPSLDGSQSGFVLIDISKSIDCEVLFINGCKSIDSDGSIDWDTIKRNILISKDFEEWEDEKLDKYFRPDIIYKLDGDSLYDNIHEDDYQLVPSTFFLCEEDLSEDKKMIELGDIFEEVQETPEKNSDRNYVTVFNLTDNPLQIFQDYKNYPQNGYYNIRNFKGESLILAADDYKIKGCMWYSDSVFTTQSEYLVLRLKKNSPVSMDYAAYALLSCSCIKEVGYNMCILDKTGNWNNFLKCQIAIYRDKAKQEEIVEHLRNEYAQQRQRELEAEMQRLGIRNASSDMVHMLGPTFAKIESTLYDLKSEELNDNVQGAIETLNDNINYIKRFIKTAGADIMLARMSMKERNVNIVISSILKSWSNLSCSRIFEVIYKSGVSDDVTIKIDESYFRVLFDTLFDNAYRHGFGKRCAIGNQVCVTSQLVQKNRKEYLLLKVANNGEPFPEDFTFQKFISRGEYCGDTGRTGLGGNHIYSILKRHNGFLYVTKNAEWNCIFEMLIPVAFKNDVESKNVCEYGNSSKCL